MATFVTTRTTRSGSSSIQNPYFFVIPTGKLNPQSKVLIKTLGIVFKSKKYSETSVIIDVFTEEKGMRSYIVSGVRSHRPTVSAGLLQPMTPIELVAYEKDGHDLTRLKEVKPYHVYKSIPFDIRRSSVGLFMIEVARNGIQGHEAQPVLFDFLLRNFIYLDETPHSIANLHLHFMVHLAEHLGFMPAGDYNAETPFFDLQEGTFTDVKPQHQHWLAQFAAGSLYQLLLLPMERCHEVHLDRDERRNLLKSLLNYYKLHMEHFPTVHSHEVLEEVLG